MIRPLLPEQNRSRTSRREAYVLSAIVIAAVLARSVVFVFWPQSHFDSDQAVTGLMAKHLSELRAFPVFWYGQSYLLAVEAWLAAPVMWVLGPTGTALKLPLLAINVAIALLLMRALVRDVGLHPAHAAFATLFFALTPPITSAHLLMANGGNVEPLLYVLLLWYARRNGILLGLVLGIGFLNREFTAYGVLALIVVAAIDGDLFTRPALVRFASMLAVAAVVWFAVQGLKQISSAAGPGTTTADLYTRMASNNIAEILRRLCFSPRALLSGAGALFTVHFPQLFGTLVQPLTDFGIESAGREGLRTMSLSLLWTFLIAAGGVAYGAVRARRWDRSWDFCAYLVLASICSAAGYVAGRCGEVDLYTMRYELLSLLGAVGLVGWYFRVVPLRAANWVVVFGTFVLATAGAADLRLLREYLHQPPVPQKQLLIDALQERHIRYGYSDFWTAYYVTFLTRERIVLAADDAVRIRTYNRIVEQHSSEAVRVSRRPCGSGEPITPAFWICQ